MTLKEAKVYYSNKFLKECYFFREGSRWYRVTQGYKEQLEEIYNNPDKSGWLFYYEDEGERYPELKKEFVVLVS